MWNEDKQYTEAYNNNNYFGQRPLSPNTGMRHLHGKKIKFEPAKFMKILLLLFVITIMQGIKTGTLQIGNIN